VLSDATPFLLLLLGVVVVIGVAVGGWALERKRREALFAWCALHGWTYARSDDSLTWRWHGTPFGVGERRRAENVLQGTVGSRPALAFDYSYQTSSTDSKGNRTTTTHRFAVVVVGGLPVPLPRLEVTPDNVLKRAAAAIGLGAEDIHLESDDFNRRFRVTCPDRKLAFDVLHPRLMQMLLHAPAVAWRFDGTELVSWDSGRVAPDEALVRAMMLSSVVDAVPTFVWKDRGYDPQQSGQPAPQQPGPPTTQPGPPASSMGTEELP
jgi:hypothetical protein